MKDFNSVWRGCAKIKLPE